MLKKVFLLFIISLCINKINYNKEVSSNNIIIEKDNNYIYAKLIIDKIGINKNLYEIDNPNNNIEKNITILKESIMPDKKNSIVFIAAHSGTGEIAFFEELDKLEENDEVILIYNNKKYIYKVLNIWEENKNGYINVNKEKENQLILTTCSPHKENYQLIINCIEKES